jgi:O-antigen/teichoic acid export membrane protein
MWQQAARSVDAVPRAVPSESLPRSLPMFLNALGLIFADVSRMGLGFVFWLLATRLFSPDEVGIAAGAVSGMMLCALLALLGVGSAFIARYPKTPRRPGPLLDTAFSVVAAAALVIAGLFLLLASGAFHELNVVASIPLYAFLFFAAAVLGALAGFLDEVSAALLRGDQAFMRGIVFGLVAITSLVALDVFFGASSSMAIFSPWVIAGVAINALGAVQLWRTLSRYRYRPRVRVRLARQLMRVGIPNHALTLAGRAPGLIFPILVLETFSSTANAHWYAAWMLAMVVYTIADRVGLTLFAELSHRPDELSDGVRRALKSALGLGLAAAAGLAATANLVLGILGGGYASGGAAPLRVLVIAIVPLAFIQVYFATCRATGSLREAILTGTLAGAAGVGLAVPVGSAYGLVGVALAWLLSQTIASAWAIWRLHVKCRRAPAATLAEPMFSAEGAA